MEDYRGEKARREFCARERTGGTNRWVSEPAANTYIQQTCGELLTVA